MKKLAALFIIPLLMVQTPLPASPPVQETPYELALAADLDGDGHADVVIADKERGTVRVAFGTPAGHEARRAVSILPGISTIAVARLAGPTANRIVVGSENSGGLRVLAVDKTNAAGFVTVDPPLEVEGIGPGRIAAMPLGWPGGTAGRDDLVVATSENGMPSVGKWETLLTGAGGSVSNGPVYSLQDAVLAGSNRVLWLVPMGTKQSTPEDLLLGAVVGSGSSTRNLMVFDPAEGDLNPKTPGISVNMNALNTNQQHMRAVSGFFGPSQQSRVLLFGYNERMVHSRAYWSGNMVIELPEFRNFSERVATITVVRGAEGVSDRLLVTFVSGAEQAALYDYDGVSFPVKVTGFATPVGGGFSGGLAMPDGGFLLLEREGFSNRTSGIARYDRDGNFLGRSTIGEPPLLSGRGNVLFLDGTPLADASARVISTVAVDDWSATVEGFGAPLKIRGETYRGTAEGLGDAANTILPSVPAGALGVVANQFAQDMSVYNFGGGGGEVQDTVEIDPPAGTYPGAVALRFRSAVNDRARANGQPESREVFYRIDTNLSTGAWLVHDPANPPRIAATSTVRFYSAAITGGAKGVIKSAVFNLPSDAIDSDGDGVPDAVEVANGLDPEAGVDTDGDGYSDLTEMYFGTDPNEGSSNPGRLADGSRVPGLDGLTGTAGDGSNARRERDGGWERSHGGVCFVGAFVGSALGTGSVFLAAHAAEFQFVKWHGLRWTRDGGGGAVSRCACESGGRQYRADPVCGGLEGSLSAEVRNSDSPAWRVVLGARFECDGGGIESGAGRDEQRRGIVRFGGFDGHGRDAEVRGARAGSGGTVHGKCHGDHLVFHSRESGAFGSAPRHARRGIGGGV
jgi:hypothetical protein